MDQGNLFDVIIDFITENAASQCAGLFRWFGGFCDFIQNSVDEAR